MSVLLKDWVRNGNKTKGSFLMAACAIKYASFCFLLLRGLNMSHYKHNFHAHNSAVHLIIGATFLICTTTYLQCEVFLHKLTAASAVTYFVINEHLNWALTCILKRLFFILWFKETYQSDMLIYGPLDAGLQHMPDPPLHTTHHHVN